MNFFKAVIFFAGLPIITSSCDDPETDDDKKKDLLNKKILAKKTKKLSTNSKDEDNNADPETDDDKKKDLLDKKIPAKKTKKLSTNSKDEDNNADPCKKNNDDGNEILKENIARVLNLFPGPMGNDEKNEILRKFPAANLYKILSPFAPPKNSELWWDSIVYHIVWLGCYERRGWCEKFAKKLEENKYLQSQILRCLEQYQGLLVLSPFTWENCEKFNGILFGSEYRIKQKYTFPDPFFSSVVCCFENLEPHGGFRIGKENNIILCHLEKDFWGGITEDQKQMLTDFWGKVCCLCLALPDCEGFWFRFEGSNRNLFFVF
ncbi:MAG: hypothetical protein LBD32_00980 [Cytophagales bacterium]|jgi:hypothetical protein|nr:hypothetical protein [Cytophagales bacterium]